jgi:hypothetical protein
MRDAANLEAELAIDRLPWGHQTEEQRRRYRTSTQQEAIHGVFG